jgi:hypothetical protein
VLIWLLAACSQPHAAPSHDASPPSPPDAAPDARVVDTSPLEVQALGVQGFVLRRGHDAVMTAPLFTRQSEIDVSLNLPITPDTTAIDSHLAGVPLDELRAVVSGHAHYDHLLDVPHVLALAPGAQAITNLTGRHIFAALAPDGCASSPPTPMIDRSRVIAMDDPVDNHVDYTNCPAQIPPGSTGVASWLQVSPHVRVMGFCSMHPPQIAGIFHFGIGSIDDDQCAVPAAASGWLEGQTLAYLIDFLDDAGSPTFRVFYQDAPTNPPIGHVPPPILADKAVDLAILCVGSYDAVQNQPGDVIASLAPRFAVSGHWEDFFQPVDSAPQPIPLLNVPTYVQRAETALPPPGDAPLVVDGTPSMARHVLALPGMRLSVPLAVSSKE